MLESLKSDPSTPYAALAFAVLTAMIAYLWASLSMGWSVYYGIATAMVLGLSWWRGFKLKSMVARDCAIGLVGWYVLVNATYQLGTLEIVQTQVIGAIFALACVWLIKRHRHWLPWYLLVADTSIMTWTAFFDEAWFDTPRLAEYWYKATKNLIYATDLLATCVSWIPWMNTKTT